MFPNTCGVIPDYGYTDVEPGIEGPELEDEVDEDEFIE